MRTYPQAKGSVTPFGYRRITTKDRRQRFEHVIVWERHHGPVSERMEIHHVNGDKLNNCVENLRLVTRLEHKRIHSGCELRDNVWWKQCRQCGEFKPLADFYQYPGRNGVMDMAENAPAALDRGAGGVRLGRELLGQRELAPLGLAEAGVFTLGGDLADDRGIRLVKTAFPAKRPSQEVFTRDLRGAATPSAVFPDPANVFAKRCAGQGVHQPLVATNHNGLRLHGQGQVQAVVDGPTSPQGQLQRGFDQIAGRGDPQRKAQEVAQQLACLLLVHFASGMTLPDDVGDLCADQVWCVHLVAGQEQGRRSLGILLIEERRGYHAGIDDAALHRSRSWRIRSTLLVSFRPAKRFRQRPSTVAISSVPVPAACSSRSLASLCSDRPCRLARALSRLAAWAFRPRIRMSGMVAPHVGRISFAIIMLSSRRPVGKRNLLHKNPGPLRDRGEGGEGITGELLGELELAALDLAEAGVLALGGDLADDGRVDGGRRRLAIGLPQALGEHPLDHVLGVQRLASIGQNLCSSVQSAGAAPLASFLADRDGHSFGEIALLDRFHGYGHIILGPALLLGFGFGLILSQRNDSLSLGWALLGDLRLLLAALLGLHGIFLSVGPGPVHPNRERRDLGGFLESDLFAEGVVLVAKHLQQLLGEPGDLAVFALSLHRFLLVRFHVHDHMGPRNCAPAKVIAEKLCEFPTITWLYEAKTYGN